MFMNELREDTTHITYSLRPKLYDVLDISHILRNVVNSPCHRRMPLYDLGYVFRFRPASLPVFCCWVSSSFWSVFGLLPVFLARWFGGVFSVSFDVL